MTLSLNNLTFIIVTFKSEDIIYKCIESLPKDSNIIIIENSNNQELKNNFMKKIYIMRFSGLLNSMFGRKSWKKPQV